MWFVLFAILMLVLVLGALMYRWADRAMHTFQHTLDVIFGPPGYR